MTKQYLTAFLCMFSIATYSFPAASPSEGSGSGSGEGSSANDYGVGFLSFDLDDNLLCKSKSEKEERRDEPRGVWSALRATHDPLLTKELDLSQNQHVITELPRNCLESFTHLEVLKIDGKHLARVDKDALRGLGRLRLLIISECAAAVLPDELFDPLASLEVLDLSRGRLTRVPSLRGNKHLVYLDISQNRLTAVPDLSGQKKLAYLMLASNNITRLRGEDLPGGGSVDYLRFVGLAKNRRLARCEMRFFEELCAPCIVDIDYTPLKRSNAYSALFARAGYTVANASRMKSGCSEADMVRTALEEDMRKKMLDYLYQLGETSGGVSGLCNPMIRRMITEKLLVSRTHTNLMNLIMWAHKHQGKITAAITIIGIISGGGIGGLLCKKIAEEGLKKAAKKIGEEALKEFAKRYGKKIAAAALGGAAAGACAGGLAGYWGSRFYFDGHEGSYQASSGDVYMTTKEQEDYVGTSRLLAVLTVLKEYLVVFATYLDLALQPKEYVHSEEELDEVTKKFKKRLHLACSVRLQLHSSFDMVHLLYELVSQDVLTKLRSCVAKDTFALQADESITAFNLDDHARYSWMGGERVVFLVNLIAKLSQLSQALRVDLYNRAYGTDNGRGVHELVAASDQLKEEIGLMERTLAPYVERLDGSTGDALGWQKELMHFLLLSTEVKRLLERATRG